MKIAPEELKHKLKLKPKLKDILANIDDVKSGYEKAQELFHEAEEEFKEYEEKKHPDYTERFFRRKWDFINIGLNNYKASLIQLKFQTQIIILSQQLQIAVLEKDNEAAIKLNKSLDSTIRSYKKFVDTNVMSD